MTISATALAVAYTATQIFERGLQIARTLGLAVTSWQVIDPTRILFKHLAEELALRDEIDATFTRSAFLSTATGTWKTLHAKEVFGVDRGEAEYARPTVSFVNNGGGYYSPGVGEITLKSTSSGKTYHNVEAFSLLGVGTTAGVVFEADEGGSASSCGEDEVDDFVTTMLEVEITGSTAAFAADEQSDESLEEECLDTLGALSPNGASDAYRSVLTNEDITGNAEITKVQVVQDSLNGAATIYVAGASGAVSSAAVIAGQAAVYAKARPIGFTPTVVAAIEQAVALTATISGDGIPATYPALASSAYSELLLSTSIGGVITYSSVIAMLQNLAIANGASNVSVEVTAPSGTVSLSDGYTAIPGAVSVTEV